MLSILAPILTASVLTAPVSDTNQCSVQANRNSTKWFAVRSDNRHYSVNELLLGNSIYSDDDIAISAIFNHTSPDLIHNIEITHRRLFSDTPKTTICYGFCGGQPQYDIKGSVTAVVEDSHQVVKAKSAQNTETQTKTTGTFTVLDGVVTYTVSESNGGINLNFRLNNGVGLDAVIGKSYSNASSLTLTYPASAKSHAQLCYAMYEGWE